MSSNTKQISSNDSISESEAANGRGIVFILCVVIVVSVLLFGAVDSGTWVLLVGLILALVITWAWSAMRQWTFLISPSLLQLPLIALAFIAIIQLLPFRSIDVPPGLVSIPIASSLSLDPYATRFFLMRLFLYIVFFGAALTFVNNLPKLKTLVIVLIAFGGIMAFYSILQRVEAPSAIYGLREPSQAIPFGTYINRHHFAALMEMTLGLTLGLIFAGRQKSNRLPFLIAAASVMAIAIVLTGSRGGMIGFVGLLALVATAGVFSRGRERNNQEYPQRSNFSRRLAYVAGGSAFFLLTVGLTLFLGGADPLLRGAGIEPGAGDFTSGRLQFWQTALKIFVNHPIIGAGLDAFGAAYSRYDPSNGLLRVEQAHNDYLQILSDAGILGFACVAMFIFLLFRQALATIRQSHDGFRRGAAIGALAGCFGILIHSFFDFPLRTPANGFVFLTLAVIAVASVDEAHARHHHRSRNDRIEHQPISER